LVTRTSLKLGGYGFVNMRALQKEQTVGYKLP